MRLFWKKKNKDYLSYRAFVAVYPCCTQEHQAELLDILVKQPKPRKAFGIVLPENLNTISYGQLDLLHRLAINNDDIAIGSANILFGVTPYAVLEEDVNKIFGFTNWLTEEISRINGLFEGIKVSHTQEELNAGVEKLNFGSFGVLDWYAHRQGIADQDQVRDVAWVRIYQCMKMDNQRNEYERRLSEQYKRKKVKK